MFGELTLDVTSEEPAFLGSWSDEIKLSELKRWLSSNFVVEEEFFYDFSEWENDQELEDHESLEPFDTETILSEIWRLYLTPEERRDFVLAIDPDRKMLWKPAEDRINIEEDEDYPSNSEEVTLEGIQNSIPGILQHLNSIEGILPPLLGHNKPPEGFEIDPSEINALKALLSEMVEIDEEEVDDHVTVLKSAANLAVKIGESVVRYVSKKGDLLLDEAAKSTGSHIGKWTVRSMVFLVAGETLISFGERIVRLIGG